MAAGPRTDGSAFFHDHDNVCIYGGYKNLFGHDQLIENNMYVYGDYTSPFDGRHPDGTDSWAEWLQNKASGDGGTTVGASSGSYDSPFCALSAESCKYNSTTKTQTQCDASGYGLVYRNNSCIFGGGGSGGGIGGAAPHAFDYNSCQLKNLEYPPTMATADNIYYTDAVANLTVLCGDDRIPLSVWQQTYLPRQIGCEDTSSIAELELEAYVTDGGSGFN